MVYYLNGLYLVFIITDSFDFNGYSSASQSANVIAFHYAFYL